MSNPDLAKHTPVLVDDLRQWVDNNYIAFEDIAPRLYRARHWCVMCPLKDNRPMEGGEQVQCDPCSADQAYEQSTGKTLDNLSGAVWIPTKTAVLLRMNCSSHETE